MKSKKLLNINIRTLFAAVGIAVGSICLNPGTISNAQTPPADVAQSLPQGVTDVVKLTQAKISETVILTKIKNDGISYSLNADQIIYLGNQGVSQNVINALLQTKTDNAIAASSNPASQPVPSAEPPPISPDNSQAAPSANPAPAAAPAPAPGPGPGPDDGGSPEPAANFDSFHEQLTPYGNWIQTPDGWVWQPNVAPGWRPYYDGGHWINTDEGWYWQSDYTWGDIAFHYGRWNYHPSYGWIWAPGYEFAPAWVCWRHADADGYCGWAPLPPGTVFVGGVWMHHGVRVAVDYDFGLAPGYFTFVAYDHFWERDYRRFIVPHDRVIFLFHRSVFENHFVFEHGRFIHVGLDRERMAHFTGREIHAENIHAIRAIEVHEHIEQRQNDRAIIRGGGRIEASPRVASAQAEAHNRPANTPAAASNNAAPQTQTQPRSQAAATVPNNTQAHTAATPSASPSTTTTPGTTTPGTTKQGGQQYHQSQGNSSKGGNRGGGKENGNANNGNATGNGSTPTTSTNSGGR